MRPKNPMLDYFIPGSYSFMKPELLAERQQDFPLMLNIETAFSCNLRCFFCPPHNGTSRGEKMRAVGMMDWALYVKIIDECASEGPLLVLNMHKDGEPTLHPRFCDMLTYAKTKNAAEVIHFNTNAVFEDDELIDKILDSGVDDITFSIDAFDSARYRRTKGRDKLETVVRNVEKFYERRDQKNLQFPYMRVKMIGTEENREEFALFKKRWEPVADEVQCQQIHNFAGGLELNRTEDLARYACEFPFYSTAVNTDGVVALCHRDYNGKDIMGNVADTSIKEVYNSRKYQEYLHALRDNRTDNLPICRTCDNWKDGPDLGDALTEGLIAARERYL
ncbi:MAG: radical SAM protein [Bdellovibrionales bacterium]|nr:radical SAM protein [Bdellovibrionales bacterium]